jgi:hypothetical protein
MTILKALDVAIGISLLYLLTTFAASAIVEFISNWRNWRGEMLHAGIGNMLGGSELLTADRIYGNPLVLGLARDNAAPSIFDLLERAGWRPTINERVVTFPSYLPAGTFSAALLDELSAKGIASTPPATPRPDIGLPAIKQALVNGANGGRPGRNDPLRAVIETTLAARGDNIQAVQFALEKWFNDAMDRVSGWYKRRTQGCLLLIGLVLAYGGNIDTIAIATWLWNGDAARQAVVNAAADLVKSPGVLAPPAAPPEARAKNGGNPPPDLTKLAEQIVAVDRQVTALQFPLGWRRVTYSSWWLGQFLVGGLLSAIAISMGSAFWFDALQSLLKIRGSGPKPGAR